MRWEATSYSGRTTRRRKSSHTTPAPSHERPSASEPRSSPSKGDGGEEGGVGVGAAPASAPSAAEAARASSCASHACCGLATAAALGSRSSRAEPTLTIEPTVERRWRAVAPSPASSSTSIAAISMVASAGTPPSAASAALRPARSTNEPLTEPTVDAPSDSFRSEICSRPMLAPGTSLIASALDVRERVRETHVGDLSPPLPPPPALPGGEVSP